MGSSSRIESRVPQYRAFVRSELRRLGVPVVDLNDLEQEVWLLGLSRSESFAEQASIPGWLPSVCSRVAQAHWSEPTPVPRVGADLHVEPEQVEFVERELDELRVASALDRLSEKQADVLALYASGELSMREVAAQLGESEKTVYSRYRTAIEDVTRELRRGDIVIPRRSSRPSGSYPVATQPEFAAQERAADQGALIVVRADRELSIGRVGNVLLVHYRKRFYESSVETVASVLETAHQRLGVPLVMLNTGNPDLALPNAAERRALFHHARASSPCLEMVVDVANGHPLAQVFASIVSGILLLSRSYLHHSFAMVATLDDARRWIEPRARTVHGALAWDDVARGMRAVSQVG
ncbi:MAG: sigma-70 family RNA polymerase sigma factor [Myxococcales bacterium]